MTNHGQHASAWDVKHPALLPALVCHADILGFKARTRAAFATGEEQALLQRLHTTVHGAVTEVERLARLRPLDPPLFEVKVYTDNLLFAARLERPDWDGGEPEFVSALRALAGYQAHLVTSGFLIRGGVAAGEHYQDTWLAYGDAMLDAIALDLGGGAPRLALTDSAVRHVLKQAEAQDGHAYALPFRRYLVDPADDRLFLDYLEIAFEHAPDAINHELLVAHRDAISEHLSSLDLSGDVWAKYLWAATYHNALCEAFVARAGTGQYAGRDDVGGETAAAAEEADRVSGYRIDLSGLPRVTPPRPVDAAWLERTRARL